MRRPEDGRMGGLRAVSTNMGNLEKLGILVIVILVVVVGVVAITPKSTVDERLYPAEEQTAVAPLEPEQLPPVDGPKTPVDPWPAASDPKAAASDPAAVPPGGMAQAPVVPPAPQEPTFRTIKVQKGDTLSSIAASELGGAKNWKKLQSANESVLHGSTNLSVGMKLTIPGATMSSGDPAPVSSLDAAPAAPAAVGEREYTVKAGDSLWLIAKNEMGSESFVKELRAANAGVLRGSDAVSVGQKLRIPAH
jgi:nucleoid-associated protein YgaU